MRTAARAVEKENDAAVVARVLAGDIEAYRILVERYQRAIVHCARQILASDGAAEEAAQEAFVQGFQKIGKLREPRYFFTWLWRICAVVALKACKRAGRMVAAGGLEDFAECSREAGTTDSPLEREERNRLLHSELARLPDEQREAITLRFWEGMEYSDIADLLGVSHAALYQRVSRGLRALRERLGPDFSESHDA